MATYYESDGTPSADDDKKAGGVPPTTIAGSTETYYENDGTASSSAAPVTGSTTFYENDGTSSSSVSSPTATLAPVVVTGKKTTETVKDRPGARPYNPLSEFSSVTYVITFYMCTPEAYNQFVVSGGTRPTTGLYIVAQSGGVNQNTPRAPGFNYDLYIDDLKLKTITSTKGTNSSTNSVDISFNIYEPYGFNFPTVLKEAAKKVQQTSSLPGVSSNPDAIAQQFLLEVKFYGYDSKGNVKTLQVQNDDATFSRIWPLRISKFSFKLTGKVTEYNIEAVNVGSLTSFGSKRGIVNNPMELTGATVYDVLAGTAKGKVITGETAPVDGKPTDNYVTGLFQALNLAEGKLYENKLVEKTNMYSIEIDESISKASLVTKDAYNKFKAPVSTNQTTQESSTKVDDPKSVDKNKRTVGVSAGTPILKIIDQVIGQSSYVESAFKVLAFEDDTESEPELSSNPIPLQWYNVNPVATILGYDTKRRDFVFDIKYVVKPYSIPFVRSAYVGKKTKYYGPHKRYEYFYTGKNSEILTFEQQFNSLYYIPTTKAPPKKNSEEPTAPGQSSAQKSSTQETQSAEATASVRTSLYSIGDLAQARMTIIGDPDYLISSIGVDNSPYKQFYGKDYTINPNGGQVFIEINFYEGIDYDLSKGTMNINDKINLAMYPPEVGKINGVVYMVVDVVSTFSKGKFVQELNLILWTPSPSSTSQFNAQRAESGRPQNVASSASDTPPPGMAINQETGDYYTPLKDGARRADIPSVASSSTDVAPPGMAINQETGDFYTPGTQVGTSPTGNGNQVQDDDQSYDVAESKRLSNYGSNPRE